MPNRLPAPSFLTTEQTELWGHVVRSVAHNHFGPQHEALLVVYVTSVSHLLRLSRLEESKVRECVEWFGTEEAERILDRRTALAETISTYTHLLGLEVRVEQEILDYTKLVRDFNAASPKPNALRH